MQARADKGDGRAPLPDPVGKVKSVVLTEEGLRRSKQLFEAMFTK
jgi:hypothetical protein